MNRDEAVETVRRAAWGSRPGNVWADYAANQILDALGWDEMDALAELGRISIEWQEAPNITAMRRAMKAWHGARDALASSDHGVDEEAGR